MLRIRPTLAEIVAGAQQRSPKTRSRRPNAPLALAGIIGKSVNRISVKERSAELPASALGVGSKNEGSLGRSHQQNAVSLSHVRMTHRVYSRGSEGTRSLISSYAWRDDGTRLHGLQGRLHFTGTLIALDGFFSEAVLDHRP